MENEKGFAMMIAIMSLLVLILLGTILLFTSHRETTVGTFSRFQSKAFFAADAGSENSLVQIDSLVNPEDWVPNQTIFTTGGGPEDQAYNSTIWYLTSRMVPGEDARTRSYIFRIDSTGRSRGDAVRNIRIVAGRNFEQPVSE